MHLGLRIAHFATSRPRFVTGLMVAVAATLLILSALPSLWPGRFAVLHGVTVDTDPENMLSKDEAVRVFHDEMKEVLSLNDLVVVGVVNEEHPNGVFNPESLGRVYELTQYAKTLHGDAIGEEDPEAGVVEVDIIAPSTVDNIEPGGLGVVRFEWLMPAPPETEEAALAIREKAQRIPFLDGTLVSEDGKALALYLPLTSKDLSYQVYSRLEDKIAEFEGADRFHITGLPVAEDTFGVEMFKQMAISAPAAMVVIFILMLVFFRKLVLIISPMIVALVSVIVTMGLLIVTGQTIHIMSSMIPIFIMPIAVLDSIHILSEFFDRYQKIKDRRKTMVEVMDHLYSPMIFTSLTSTAGFASLALTPIPPVQVFGIFVAIGIMTAWFLTVTFIPAFVMFIPERSLENFGLVHHEDKPAEEQPHGLTGRFLGTLRSLTYEQSKFVLAGTVLAVGIAVYGITRIEINDNPTKWFKSSHPIRVADRVLNEHFGGTYMAYLALQAPEASAAVSDYAANLEERMDARASETADAVPEARAALPEVSERAAELAAEANSKEDLLDSMSAFIETRMDEAEGDAYYGWEEWSFFIDEERQRGELFKRPEALEYIASLQDHLLTTGVVGKSNSLSDIVKTVHRELFEGEPEEFKIPDSSNAVAQCLITYESSHRPQDLYHFVTPDYRTSSIWVQLTSGDNRDMSEVVAAMDAYMAEHPPPFGLDQAWFGLTYINVVWQDKMVSGMLQAFLGSFLVVLLMMILLFRSALWGLLCMIPLTVTIGLIYGVIGIIGKDYDMPVAVLSSLTLGLAVDFAIHFLVRARALYEQEGNWKDAHALAFGEPARAITRNVIVIAVGFLPLLAAPLRPYITVGFFLAAILFISGAGTLLILPSIMRYMEPLLFPAKRSTAFACHCGTCIIAAVAAVALVALNVHQFMTVGLTPLTYITLGAIPVAALACWLLSRRRQCATGDEPGASSGQARAQ